ncbi:hypothetical protein BDR22DRAFT_526336 [Usnea florida]
MTRKTKDNLHNRAPTSSFQTRDPHPNKQSSTTQAIRSSQVQRPSSTKPLCQSPSRSGSPNTKHLRDEGMSVRVSRLAIFVSGLIRMALRDFTLQPLWRRGLVCRFGGGRRRRRGGVVPWPLCLLFWSVDDSMELPSRMQWMVFRQRLTTNPRFP